MGTCAARARELKTTASRRRERSERGFHRRRIRESPPAPHPTVVATMLPPRYFCQDLARGKQGTLHAPESWKRRPLGAAKVPGCATAIVDASKRTDLIAVSARYLNEATREPQLPYYHLRLRTKYQSSYRTCRYTLLYDPGVATHARTARVSNLQALARAAVSSQVPTAVSRCTTARNPR
jgi:hypothetical protein